MRDEDSAMNLISHDVGLNRRLSVVRCVLDVCPSNVGLLRIGKVLNGAPVYCILPHGKGKVKQGDLKVELISQCALKRFKKFTVTTDT